MSLQFGMFRRLKLRLLGWLQNQCQHPAELVIVDIADGEFSVPISWCRLCGGVRIRDSHHLPSAHWWIKENEDAHRRLMNLPWYTLGSISSEDLWNNYGYKEGRTNSLKLFGGLPEVTPNLVPMPKVNLPKDSEPSPQQLAECDCARFSVANSTICIWPKCAEVIRRA
jgi:hypothetical protein